MPSQKNNDTITALNQKIDELNNQINQLQSGHSTKGKTSSYGNSTITAPVDSLSSGATRLVQSCADATAELYSGVSGVTATFSDELNQRTKNNDKATMLNLSGNVYSSLRQALQQSMDIPGSVFKSFTKGIRGGSKAVSVDQ